MQNERGNHATVERVPQSRKASQHSSRKRSIFFIVLIAFLLRLAVITIGHTYRITPRRDHFQYGWEMGRIARSIATGQGFSSPTDLPTGLSAWAPPLYPYILGGVFKLFGVYSFLSAWVILIFNSVVSSLTCLTLYHIGGRMYGVSVGRATAWTWALFPYAIYWPTRVVWETSLTAFLLSLALLLTLRMADHAPQRSMWILFGLLWGLIGLTNTAVLSMFPFCPAWLIFTAKRRDPANLSPPCHPDADPERSEGESEESMQSPLDQNDSKPFRDALRGTALSVIIAIVVITPWVVRNYAVFGKFIFVRDNFPLELHMANNEETTGLWTRSEHPGNDPMAMRRFHELGEIRFMEEKQQEVRRFIREHPERFLWFTLQRVVYFWIAPPQLNIVAGYDLMIARHVGFLIPALFAFAGLWLTTHNGIHGAFLLACFLLIYPIPYYLVNPFPRYKHPIEPEIILLAVYLFWVARGMEVRWPVRGTS
jgi:4-amino-4-deoxy-L-arabinose transferase-like glycosyltransferase